MPLSSEEKARRHRIAQRKYQRSTKGRITESKYNRSGKGLARNRRSDRKPERLEQKMWDKRSRRRYIRIQENRI